MINDTQNIYSAEQIRRIEQTCTDQLGTPGFTLMQRAGQAVYRQIVADFPRATHILVVCGPGNNGGDGYVIATLLQNAGCSVRLISLAEVEKLQGDAALARDGWLQAGGEIADFDGELPKADLIIDALLGTGLQRPLSGAFLVAVQLMNDAACPVIAVDIPSGLNADTGAVMGSAVIATSTVTFIAHKLGLLTGRGVDYSGRVILNDLQAPAAAFAGITPIVRCIGETEISTHLPPRKASSFKNDFGHLLVCGGDRGMSGAARMAAEAAMRSGTGLVTVATHHSHAHMLNQACPVLMSHGVSTGESLHIALEKKTALVIGPGLGLSNWSRACWNAVSRFEGPMVIDADALNLLAQTQQRRDNRILTPHPGEAARLLRISTHDLQQNRLQAAQHLQAQYGGVVVLKGAGTLICSAAGVYLCRAGNPGMATAGMGDVLSGVIGALCAQQLPLDVAARIGVQIHAMAGDKAAADQPRGLLAADVIAGLREVVNP